MGRWFLRRAAAASGAMVYPPLRLRRASRRAARASRASSARLHARQRALLELLLRIAAFALWKRRGRDGCSSGGEVSGGGPIRGRRRGGGRVEGGEREGGERQSLRLDPGPPSLDEEVFSRRARKRDGRRPPFYPPLRAGLECIGSGVSAVVGEGPGGVRARIFGTGNVRWEGAP